MTYEQLDVIADIYIPALALISAVLLRKSVTSKTGRPFISQLKALLSNSVFVYFVYFLDKYFSIWPHYHLDYSTHTALVLVFICYLSTHGKAAKWLAISSFFAYLALMIYQGYHTLLDIASTAAVILPVLLVVQRHFHAKSKVS